MSKIRFSKIVLEKNKKVGIGRGDMAILQYMCLQK
jgi:hypothetical protein